jgi:hypothetical protein
VALVASAVPVLGAALIAGSGSSNGEGVISPPPVAGTPSATAVGALGAAPAATPPGSLLDDRQVGLVRTIALEDSTVREILGSRMFEIGRVAGWTTVGGVEVLGGVAEVCVDPGLHGRFRVPVVSFDEATDEEPYRRSEWTYDFTGRTALLVSVDLRLMQVVHLRPGPEFLCS